MAVGDRALFVALEDGQQLVLTPQKAAQHAVDEAAGPRFFQDFCCVDGGVNGGVIGGAKVEDLVEAEQQQRTDRLLLLCQRFF